MILSFILTFILYRLREEVDQVLGSKSEITNADLIKLEYTNCVFKEALRMWPPVTGVPRRTQKDMYFGKNLVPKNTRVLVNQSAINLIKATFKALS